MVSNHRIIGARAMGEAGGLRASVFIRAKEGVPFEKALEKAERENRVIASNRAVDGLLNSGDCWMPLREAFICATGTWIAYTEPDVRLGKMIEHTEADGIRFLTPVPRQFWDERNAALVAQHPFFRLEAHGNDRIIRAAKLDLIRCFPPASGHYLGEPDYGMPAGDEVGTGNPAALRLERARSMSGPIHRTPGNSLYDARRTIYTNGPSFEAGAIAEEPWV